MVAAPVLTLRPTAPEDRELLVAVYAGTREDELAPVPWTPAQKDAFVRMQFAAQDTYWREQKPAAEFMVVLADEIPVGRLYVDRLPNELRIVDIALLPAHRGRGIGTALLTDLLEEGRRAGLPVTIHVEQQNRARVLYQRLGFTHRHTDGVHDLLEWRADQEAATP